MKVQASAYCFSLLSAKFPSLKAPLGDPMRSYLGLPLSPSRPCPEGLFGEQKKVVDAPAESWGRLAYRCSPGHSTGPPSELRAERPRVRGKKKKALRRAISIPFNRCLCWARLSSDSGSKVSCQRGRSEGDRSAQRLSGARGPHNRSLPSGRIYRKFARGSSEPWW